MDRLMGRVLEALIELGWNFWVPINEGNDTFMLVVEARHAFWVCLLEALEDSPHLLVQVLLPVKVPEARVAAASEYVSRADELILVGGFVLHRDSRTVRFRQTLDMADQFLTVDRLRAFVHGAIANADQHMPSLMKVALCAARPIDALDQVACHRMESVIRHANKLLGE